MLLQGKARQDKTRERKARQVLENLGNPSQKITKITPKSSENHFKKCLGRVREPRKRPRAAKKRSKTDFETIFEPSGAPLGTALGHQNEPKSAQEAAKRHPRAFQEQLERHLGSSCILTSIFIDFWAARGLQNTGPVQARPRGIDKKGQTSKEQSWGRFWEGLGAVLGGQVEPGKAREGSKVRPRGPRDRKSEARERK